jgi:hypothetical protein
MNRNEAMALARKAMAANDETPAGLALVALLQDIEWREQRCSMEDFNRLRAEVDRLNSLIRRIIEWRGHSSVAILGGPDAFSAAREYFGQK